MHDSVLLREAVTALAIQPDGIYIDGTFGRGGHSFEILRELSSKGQLWAFDKDSEAIEHANKMYVGDDRFRCFHSSFVDIKRQVEKANMAGEINGILLDLGVSSPQLDTPERGFSFTKDGPLDMRMDKSQGQSAAEWLNQADQQTIKHVLKRFGEENFAGLIAKKIIERREEKPFVRTLDLAKLIENTIPRKFHQKKHPATRSFQAIRIHINSELEDLEQLLLDSLSLLRVGGRLVVISFHSLEDRMVKQFIRRQERGPVIPKNIPIIDMHRAPYFKRVNKALKPTDEECLENTRSRSAILRIAEKVSGNG